MPAALAVLNRVVCEIPVRSSVFVGLQRIAVMYSEQLECDLNSLLDFTHGVRFQLPQTLQ